MKYSKFLACLVTILFIILLRPASARALTVENASEKVLYCSIYRQGYAMPLAQFVILPGKQCTWASPVARDIPLVVRALAERHRLRPVAPVSCTVHDHLATVVADQTEAGLTLDVRAPRPLR